MNLGARVNTGPKTGSSEKAAESRPARLSDWHQYTLGYICHEIFRKSEITVVLSYLFMYVCVGNSLGSHPILIASWGW